MSITDKAREFYGYGSWEAPFWFIGPEEGLDERTDATRRGNAWLHHFDGADLCDCREFHLRIGLTKFHQLPAPLQPTWRPLILLLMNLLKKPSDKESLRSYQRFRLGARDGETCLIELSGLPAQDLVTGAARALEYFTPAQIQELRQERMAVIRRKLLEHRPALVVMYGLRDELHWNAIVGGRFSDESIQGKRAGIRQLGQTVAVMTPHPVYKGMTNAYWIELAERLGKIPSIRLPGLN